MTDPIVRRLKSERQALYALGTPLTAVQMRRLAEIRAQLDGIAAADAHAATPPGTLPASASSAAVASAGDMSPTT